MHTCIPKARPLTYSAQTMCSITSDHACNKQSPIPNFYDWDIAENHGTLDPLIWISTFSNKQEIKPAIVQLTFEELESFCSSLAQDSDEWITYSPSTLVKSQNNSGFDACCSFLAYEFNNLPEHVTSDDLLACVQESRSFCYTTSNHRSFTNGGYYSVVVELSESVSSENYKFIAHKLSERFGDFAGYIELRSLSPTHKFDFPRINDKSCEFDFSFNVGQSLDVYEYLGNVWGGIQ